MQPFALHGDHIWVTEAGGLRLMPDSFSVCGENGLCAGVFPSIPEAFAGISVRDLRGQIIVPGYTDLHTHAAQVRNIGLGMDHQLIDWLSDLTYPEEARFRDPDFARTVYERFASELRAGLTTRAVIFASAHTEASLILSDLMEQTGLVSYIGRVNMDRNAPDYLREPDAASAAAETEAWLRAAIGRHTHTFPILTPRFIPSCTPALLEALSAIRAKYRLPVQSHLDEQPEEVDWVLQLCPGSRSYADEYDRYGFLENSSVMAHCIYMTEEETALLKRRGTFIAHCPGSNANVRSGIAPARRYLDQGLHVGLGTDISGGSSLDMADAVRDALSASRLLWRLSDEHPKHLSTAEVFSLATAGGGAFFGRVGRFDTGYEFDAVAVNDSRWSWPGDSLEVRFEKFIFHVRSSDVTAKYAAGRKLF